jgi:hypothetical protein
VTAPQPDYQTALAVAAAQLAAAQDPERYAQNVVATASENMIVVREQSFTWASRRIQRMWSQVDPYDGRAVQNFTEQSAETMRLAQSATARAAAAAQVQQLDAVGVKVDAVPSDPLDIRAPKVRIAGGAVELIRKDTAVDYTPEPSTDTPNPKRSRVTVTVREYSTTEIFNRPARDYRYNMSQGLTPDQAMQTSVERIDGLIDDNLMLAQRLAEAEALAQAANLDRRVIGYRRVIHPEQSRGGSCGMCIAASDRVYKVRELKPIHGRCNCTVAAVTKDFDPGDLVNAVDLSALYGDAQGNQAAELKRTRYQVDEHGELGAVLVPTAAYRPRSPRAKGRATKARTKTSATRG